MGHKHSKPAFDVEKQREKLHGDVLKVEKEMKYLEEVRKKKKAQKEKEMPDGSKYSKNYNLGEINWPDPDPIINSRELFVDDVTRMNAKEVDRIFFVRCAEDVQHVLRLARAQGKTVSMRGTKHSMGGHTISENGFVIDMARLNHMNYEKEKSSIKVGPGALWSQVVLYLNRFGMSPQTLQSYSTFSVGGSLSVNAHGITSDESMQDSVISITVIKWDGTEVVCTRDGDGEGGELFGLVLGGYGMFGVMVEVELKIQPNVHLWMDMIECTSAEFPILYKNILQSDDVDIKLGRIDTVSGEKCQLFVFRRQMEPGMRTISNLPLEPRKMSKSSQMMYKWILPSGKALRSAVENATSQALDWSDENERNLLIYESVEPLARMYSPFHELDDTFVLQEFFVPAKNFSAWLQQAKPTLTGKHERVTLLNCTVRYVLEDKTTLLAYSRTEGGSYAFVLYYRIRKCPEADNTLEEIHKVLANISLNLGGTFYLPYRHHYSVEDLKAAYPMIQQFFEKKMHFDPHGMFSSSWSDNYMNQVIPDFRKTISSIEGETEVLKENLQSNQEFEIRIASQKRTDSYKKLMSNPVQRNEFIELFFTNIFNIESKNKLKGLLAKAVADPRNSNDIEVYQCLKQNLSDKDGPLNQMSKIWKSIQQTRRQRKELVRETVTMLHRLKRLGNIDGYVSIGDTGKLVRELTENKFITGKTWVVHDSLGGIPQMLERGSENEVGEFVHIDYKNPVTIKIPSDSADLVTLNQGLHHFPQDTIIPFLQEVNRILRDGGLFIVREHDAVPDLIPVLDLAHSVFNVVTGVTEVDEREEIRAFRPILEWRKIIESAGFTDTYLYEMEPGDPTIDEMLCFYKGSILHTGANYVTTVELNTSHEMKLHEQKVGKPDLGGLFPDKIEASIEAIAKNGPNILLELAKNTVEQLLSMLMKLSENAKSANLGLTDGQQFVVKQLLNQILTPLIDMLTIFQPYLNEAKVKEADFDLIPDELIVLVKALVKKAKEGNASPVELILVGMIKDVQDFFMNGNNGPSDETGDNNIEVVNVTKEEVERLIERLLIAMPALKDFNNIEGQGFNRSTITLIKSQIGKTDKPLTARTYSEALYPYIDQYSWTRIAPALEEIIQDPETYRFSYENMIDKRNPWWHATMGLLSGQSVKFTSYGTSMASMLGLGPIIEMWKVAQTVRSQEKPNGQQLLDTALSTKTKNMLESAVTLLKSGEEKEEASLESMMRCLRLAGVVKVQGERPEFTWFKLVEWLQVEYVEIFGSYMHQQPWYQFPFGKMLGEYFSILLKEMKIVFDKHGAVKAGLSAAFLTDFIPGVVMSLLFGQLSALALPIRAVLGDEYSETMLASQFEKLVVHSNSRSMEEWKEIDADITAETLVNGLSILKVPSLGKFTDVIITLALHAEDIRILTISDHTEIQMKVSINTDKDEIAKTKGRLEHINGVTVKFDYTLPTVGKDPDFNIPCFVALGVAVPHLLSAIRAIVKLEEAGVAISQIYDYWN